MVYFSLAFIAGIALINVTSPPVFPFGYPSLAILLCLVSRFRVFRYALILLLAATYASWRADLIIRSRLPLGLHGKVVSVEGVIEAESDFGRFRRLTIGIDTARTLGGHSLALRKARLDAFAIAEDMVGKRCHFFARLKAPVGRLNPGGFDQERWLFRQRIGATGYVFDHPGNVCRPTRLGGLQAVRQWLHNAVEYRLAPRAGRAAVKALLLAQTADIDPHTWEVLRATGTAHLLAISGLHVAFISGFVFVSARFVFAALIPASRRLGAQGPAACAAVTAAVAYSALAGFALPTQRAVVMVSVLMLGLVLARRTLSVDGLCLAALVLLIIDPFVLLAPGFWLSFGAVAVLLVFKLSRAQHSAWRLALQTHVVLAIGLAPLLAATNAEIPVGSPIANLLAVPVVGLVIVPLVLLGAGSVLLDVNIGSLAWSGAAWLWELLLGYLSLVHELMPAYPTHGAGHYAVMPLAALGVAILLVPIVRRRRWLVTSCLAPLFIQPFTNIEAGAFRVAVLDVGQGLAVIVQTENHNLLYDTGPGFAEFSSGESIVVPAARTMGIGRFDALVISHPDNDHAGGAAAVVDTLPVSRLLSNEPLPQFPTAGRCRAGMSWHWDDVEFRFLFPAEEPPGAQQARRRNDRSCVLMITGAGGRVLLPGDVESVGEQDLLQTLGGALSADIVVAPHHGSATSSTPGFVTALDPKHVVFASGFHNRFGFPDRTVVARYRCAGAAIYNTGVDGAVRFDVRRSGIHSRTARRGNVAYWRLALDHAAIEDPLGDPPGDRVGEHFPMQCSSDKVRGYAETVTTSDYVRDVR